MSTPGSDAQPEGIQDTSTTAIKAWLLLALLMVASIVSFVDRQVVAIVVEPMKVDLAISDSQIGWLYGVFAVFYAVAAWPLAYLADRYSRKHIIAVGVFVWSLMTIACGLSRNFWQVLTARVGVGIGEASLGPATVSMVGDTFPRRQIPLALSVFQTAAVMGSGLAFLIGGLVLELVQGSQPVVLPWVGALKPWQLTFIYVGVPGLLLSGVFLLITEPQRRELNPPAHGIEPLRQFYRTNTKAMMLHHGGFLAFALAGYAFVFWTVSYFVRVHGEDAAQAAQAFGLIFLLTGPLGPVLAALLARRLTERGHHDGNIRAAQILGTLGIPCVVLIQFLPSAQWAYLMYIPAMIFVNAPFGLANGSLAVVAPRAIHAQVAAVYLFVVSIGNLLGPPVAGFFNEVVFPETDGVRFSMISVVLMFGLAGTVLLQLARKPYARAYARMETLENSKVRG